MSHGPRLLRGARGLFQYARLDSRAPTSSWAGFANAALDEAAASQPSTSGQSISLRSNQLTAASVGEYYALEPRLLPEASRAYAGAFYAPREAGHERRGGCKALQQEVEATGSHAVMYRPAMHALYNAVGERSHQRLLLTGPAGSGKSIALVGLVEWARQQGWLVMYVPSCSQLVRGGYFTPRGSTGTWDTLTSAQQLLKGMLDAHAAQLKSLPVLASAQPAAGLPPAEAEGPAAVGSAEWAEAAAAKGKTLHDVVVGGLTEDDNAQQAVDSVLALVGQLAASSAEADSGAGLAPPVQVLFALDDYNCLYGATDYGTQPPSASPIKARRRVLQAQELNLARGMRMLEAQSLGGAAVVAATTAAMSLPAPKTLPAGKQPITELVVPGYSEVETRNALAHYHATSHASELATSRQARQLLALTQGNARELRVNAATLGVRIA